jgi:hypothetical protein
MTGLDSTFLFLIDRAYYSFAKANLLLFFQISHASSRPPPLGPRVGGGCFLGSLKRYSYKHSSLMPPSCGGGLIQLAISFTNNKLEKERGGGGGNANLASGEMPSVLSDFIC